MQLEGGEALLHAFLDVPLVLADRVPGDGGRIDRDAVRVAAEQLVERQVRLARLDVPGELIDQAELADIDLLDPVDLPDQRPEPFGQQRILADQRLETPPRQARDGLPVLHLEAAGDALIGVHAQDRRARRLVRGRAVAGTGQTLAPAEGMTRMLILDDVAAQVGDPHAARLSAPPSRARSA